MEKKLAILDILKDDAKIPNETIARMLGLTEEEVAAAIAEMEKDGIIMKYSAIVNSEVLGDKYGNAEAMIELTVSPVREFGYDDIARRVYKFPEVKAVYLMSGRYDLAVRVECKTMKEISKFVWEKLAVLDGVTGTQTLFLMRKYKEHGMTLLEEEKDTRLVVTA